MGVGAGVFRVVIPDGILADGGLKRGHHVSAEFLKIFGSGWWFACVLKPRIRIPAPGGS